MTATVHRDGQSQESLSAQSPKSTVAALRATFDSGRTKSVDWRLRQLDALERLLVENEKTIADAVEQDLGRDAFYTWMVEIQAVTMEIAFTRKHLRRWVKPTKVALPLSFKALGRARYAPTPRGVVMVVGPWNYPINLSLGPLIGALAAGNTVVVKPSEMTPASSRVLAELVPRYLDKDAVRVVEGGPEATQALIDQKVDYIMFTGSGRVGKIVAAAAAEHLTPVTLELGGKCPTIVAKDANLDVAARRIVSTKLINVGQTCIAPDYVLVEKPVADEFVRKLVAEFTKQRTDAGRDIRVVHRKHAEHIARLLESSGGERVLQGSVDLESLRVEPVVIVNPDPGSPLMNEEIFGPVLPVLPVGSLAEATAFVRERAHPLAINIFTESKAVEQQVLAETTSGAAVVNYAAFHFGMPMLPFGGVGASGYGLAKGEFAFRAFSHLRAVLAVKTWPDLPLLYPPFTRAKRQLVRAMLR
jgi:aldehyde dehydrogenase (NAD+)